MDAIQAGRPIDQIEDNTTGKSQLALILVDVINPLDFPESEAFLQQALPAARNMAAVKRRATEAGVPVVYANDNFGKWRSDLSEVVQLCLEPGSKGKEICELLRPSDSDYFVLKPRHSAFYSTPLELLLGCIGARTLVICGFAANICVLFTAHDAYMRGFSLVIPNDCVASNTCEESSHTLKQMAAILKADTRSSFQLRFSRDRETC
jgi:nicotinamidase-related amidase